MASKQTRIGNRQQVSTIKVALGLESESQLNAKVLVVQSYVDPKMSGIEGHARPPDVPDGPSSVCRREQHPSEWSVCILSRALLSVVLTLESPSQSTEAENGAKLPACQQCLAAKRKDRYNIPSAQLAVLVAQVY